jgi:hypothetical protein
LRASVGLLVFGTIVGALSTVINLWALLLGWVVLAALFGSRFADRHTPLVHITAAVLGALGYLVPALLFVALDPGRAARPRRIVLIGFAMLHVVAAVAIFAYTFSHPIDL